MLFSTTLLQYSVSIVASTIFLAGSSFAADRFVATHGSDASNNCSSSSSPCLTLQNGVNQSAAGDTIHIATGTYTSGLVQINKTLTILGAQAGVDARTRSGPESILSNSQGISVSASNVVFDGLTVQDSSVAAFTGYGIWLNPGVGGTQIINNIFQHNISGIGLANSGGTQCLIQHNLFQNNNLPGAADGTGIYTDEYVGGGVSNVLINENKFVNDADGAVILSSQDTTRPDSNITMTNNVIEGCGRGAVFYNTRSSIVTGNTISNLITPIDGGSSTGIGIWGADSDITVTMNNIETGVKYGIYLINALTPPNTNVIIHKNNIFGFATAGMQVTNAPQAPADFATCNWWGAASGPTSSLNPGGTGDKVNGNVVAQNFIPFLLAMAPGGPCGKSTPTISTQLSSSSIRTGESVQDSATLTGASANAGGTVTYSVYQDSSCTVLADVGSGPVIGNGGTQTVTHGAVPASSDLVFSVSGYYYWQASYSGDAFNNPTVSACSSEPLVVISGKKRGKGSSTLFNS